ncbi:MAG: protein-L-isoaspartate(D-aspartate) O-methyltransferase [Nitrospinae bacterium]|nr:protein-L-isoaspartate(D-aspartate) O-methyltransferase [Nitrospinota bacterium]
MMYAGDSLRLEKLRNKMVDEQIIARKIHAPTVIKAMRDVPRHSFVSDFLKERAYDDCPLPIDESQTISQPYIVALMTELLEVEPTDKVLEIGTGSGYQTAILATLAKKVFTVERHRSLATKVRKLFDQLGYHNIASRSYDGTYGWKEFAPFNKIMVTAASPVLPESLSQQLMDGGKIVIPIGDESSQIMKVYTKNGDYLNETNSIGCQFVKLVGEYGWKE